MAAVSGAPVCPFSRIDHSKWILPTEVQKSPKEFRVTGGGIAQWTSRTFLPSLPPSRHKDHKDDEEEYENAKDFNHEPSVGGDGLEILQNLAVRGFHVQLRVFHIGVDSERTRRRPIMLISENAKRSDFNKNIINLTESENRMILILRGLRFAVQRYEHMDKWRSIKSYSNSSSSSSRYMPTECKSTAELITVSLTSPKYTDIWTDHISSTIFLFVQMYCTDFHHYGMITTLP